MRRALPFFLVIAAAGCSLVNALDDIVPGTGGSTSSTVSSTSTGPECTTNDQCASLTGDCKVGTCNAVGKCEAMIQPAGTPCGSATATDCDAADTCDMAGVCQPNTAAEGSYCDDCPLGPGQCSLCTAAKCNDCPTRATVKTFNSVHAIEGWSVTGGWGLYTQTPTSAGAGVGAPPVPFAQQVFGTDGNRVHPYPGNEHEISSATTPPTVLPAVLQFMSWNWDEGGIYDQKTIAVSINNGMSFKTVAICPNQPPYPYVFCQGKFGDPTTETFQPVAIDLNVAYPEAVGKVGLVRFSYDTGDAAQSYEKGWYIDQLNFATDCACTADPECAFENGACADATCDLATSRCVLTPKNVGGACGDFTDKTCSAPDSCDSRGLCDPHDDERDNTICDACSDGSGLCDSCGGGICLNCPPLQTFEQAYTFTKWTLAGGWGYYSQPAPLNSPSVGGNPDFADTVFGNDGVRTKDYWPFNPASGTYVYEPNTIEDSAATTPSVVLPDIIKFDSWHVDRGGVAGRDVKRISVTVGGNTTVLVDCNGGALHTLPFCQPVMSRAIDAWDAIEIPTGALAGMVGVVEFKYESADTGFNWEQGWYIDNINLARCGDH
ncbi:MAG: hypothetical protein U0414_17780 [Polyangiaceae bacterium]